MRSIAGVLLFLAVVITNIIIERDGDKRMTSKDETDRYAIGNSVAIGFGIMLGVIILILLLWE